jgi:hypothetical protein
METWSGIPAFSNEHREYYNRRRAELSSKMREYIGCHDLARLPLPFQRDIQRVQDSRHQDPTVSPCPA